MAPTARRASSTIVTVTGRFTEMLGRMACRFIVELPSSGWVAVAAMHWAQGSPCEALP
jgi:hypothetical protein